MATALAIACAAVLLSACGGFQERVCSEGEYPVWSVEHPETGRACVPDGQEPTPGYAPYPPGLVPEYVEDVVNCQEGACDDGRLAIECPDTYPDDPCTIAGRDLPHPAPQRGDG